MLQRALPIIARDPAIGERADTATLLRDLRDRFLRLLRFLGDFIAKGGPLS
jgi:hypothetical protein